MSCVLFHVLVSYSIKKASSFKTRMFLEQLKAHFMPTYIQLGSRNWALSSESCYVAGDDNDLCNVNSGTSLSKLAR